MDKINLGRTCVLFVLTALFGSANAGIISTWTDETSFIIANPAAVMESFESTSSLAGNPCGVCDSSLPLSAGDITVSTSNAPNAFDGAVLFPSTATDGTHSVRFSASNVTSIFFSFGTAIDTFGINIVDFGTSGTSGTPTLTLHDGLGNSVTALTGLGSSLNVQFFGFRSDVGITQVEFKYMANGAYPGDGIYFDETYYGESSVPEPATLALLGLGLAGLRFSRRKKV